MSGIQYDYWWLQTNEGLTKLFYMGEPPIYTMWGKHPYSTGCDHPTHIACTEQPLVFDLHMISLAPMDLICMP